MANSAAADAAIGSTEAAGLAAAHEPVRAVRLPFVTRVQLFLRIWTIKLGVSLILRLMRVAHTVSRNKTLPTYTKFYPVRPSLENRVFIPSSFQPGTKRPLFIVIHGGGFAFAEPFIDDQFNRTMADEHGFVVVGINYRKAPTHPFPTCVEDCAEIARAVLADTDLPVDHDRVSMGGFSAGGNLTLAIAQLPGIKDRVHSLVPVYPVVDFSGKYKGPYRTTPDGKQDSLKSMGPAITYAYISPGQDKSDRLLSPVYASRAQLPQRMFFITAEYDYLAHEAEIMARKLAGLYDESKGLDGSLTENGVWEANGIRFRLVPGVIHGWTHMPLKGDEEKKRLEGLKVLWNEVAEWLKQS